MTLGAAYDRNGDDGIARSVGTRPIATPGMLSSRRAAPTSSYHVNPSVRSRPRLVSSLLLRRRRGRLGPAAPVGLDSAEGEVRWHALVAADVTAGS